MENSICCQSSYKRRSLSLVRVLGTLCIAALLSACAQLKQNNQALLDKLSSAQANTADLAATFSKNTASADAAVNYAVNLRSLGEDKKAFSVLSHAFRVNPANKRVASEFGRLALKMGNLRIADKALVRADEADWRVLSAKGTLLSRQGKHKKAERTMLRALVLAPDKPSLMNNLALVYALNGKADEAEQLLRLIVPANEDNDQIKHNLSLIVGLQGKFSEARELSEAILTQEDATENDSYLRQLVHVKHEEDSQTPEAKPSDAQSAHVVKPPKPNTPIPSAKPVVMAKPAVSAPAIVAKTLDTVSSAKTDEKMNNGKQDRIASPEKNRKDDSNFRIKQATKPNDKSPSPQTKHPHQSGDKAALLQMPAS